MSTTVSYKGQTLTTVSNDTKTLLTEGKYLEDDLTLTDVSGSGAVLTTKNISANGTYNASSDSADGYSQVTVAVPASAVDSGTKSISTNGTYDVVGYASASVSVPNSYSASDEGKVVSNGALVAQTSDTVTENDTYDTTLINSLTVNVSGGGGSVPSCVNDMSEITFASAYTTALQFYNGLLSAAGITPQTGHLYLCGLTDKNKANWIADQVLTLTFLEDSGAGTVGRYRSSNIAAVNIANNFDAKNEIGDTYLFTDVIYTPLS